MRSSAGGLFGAALLIAVAGCGDDEAAGEPQDSGAESAAGSGGSARAEAGERGAAGTSGGSAGAAAGSGGADARAGDGAPEPDPAEPDAGAPPPDAGEDPPQRSGTFLALTYNVAGLPEGLSSSMPERNTPLIGPLLNAYDLVFLQESWQTPDPNPFLPLRVYHEILVAASDHPFKTEPAPQPFGADASRPSALLSDGLNVFSRFPLGETRRYAWATCVDTASDCLAFKGFSMTEATLDDGLPLHIYNLHMEAGQSAADDAARAMGIEQLLAVLEASSSGYAVIVGGDFNLHTETEPARSQFARLLEEGELKDACSALQCEDPASIDKILFRSSATVELEAESWQRETDVFVTGAGEPLSDHPPVAVRFAWRERR